MAALQVTHTPKSLRAWVAKCRKAGQRIALVPTMGALHEGHMSLVEIARREADRVIVSIFVNPTQFGAGEDFGAYPRDEAADRAKLKKAGPHLVYAPGAEAIYPEGFDTRVHVGGVSETLCGPLRPGHFDAVATVVTKLLNQAQPDVVVFGEKDWQQLVLIRQLVRDLDLPVRIVGAPIVREEDGLALSSRNAYLGKDEREVAPLLHALLKEAARSASEGRTVADVLEIARDTLARRGFKVDYFELREADTLAPVIEPGKPARVFAAVRLGKTRLIDNVAVPSSEPTRNRKATRAAKKPVAAKKKSAVSVKNGRKSGAKKPAARPRDSKKRRPARRSGGAR